VELTVGWSTEGRDQGEEGRERKRWKNWKQTKTTTTTKEQPTTSGKTLSY